MNHPLRKLILIAALSAAPLAFQACSSDGDEGEEEVVEVVTTDGAAIVDTYKTSATVTAIDPATRKVSLVMQGGRKTSYKCGPQVVNFAQIKVGDKVYIQVTEELAVYLGKGAPPSAAGASEVALAPIGSKPGGVVAKVVQITVQVTSVDAKNRKVTFKLPDGSSKTLTIGKGIDLTTIAPGDNVTVQHAESIAISVETP
jgi:hypothetical protein